MGAPVGMPTMELGEDSPQDETTTNQGLRRAGGKESKRRVGNRVTPIGCDHIRSGDF